MPFREVGGNRGGGSHHLVGEARERGRHPAGDGESDSRGLEGRGEGVELVCGGFEHGQPRPRSPALPLTLTLLTVAVHCPLPLTLPLPLSLTLTLTLTLPLSLSLTPPLSLAPVTAASAWGETLPLPGAAPLQR